MLNRMMSKGKITVTGFVVGLFPFVFLAAMPVMVYVLLVHFPQEMLLPAVGGMAGLLFAFLFVFYLPLQLKQRIKYISVLSILAILPFQNSLNLLIGFSIRAPIMGLWAFFFVDAILTRFALRRDQALRLSLFEALALLLIAWATLYLPVSSWAGDSMIGGVYGYLFGFQGLFAYFVISSLHLTNKQAKTLLVVMLISLIVVVGYGFFEFMWARYEHIDWLAAHSRHPHMQQDKSELGYYRIQRNFGSSFYRSMSFELEFVTFGYTGYVLSVILLALVILSRRFRRNRKMWLALILSTLGLGSSVTLSAIGVFFLSFWIVGWEAFRHRGTAKVIWGFLPILVLIGLVVGMFIAPGQFEFIRQQVTRIELGRRNQFHLTDLQELVQDLPRFALIGRGSGTSGPGSGKFFPKEEYGYFIESEYIGNAAEWGLPGLMIYLLFMFSLVRHVIRLKHRYVFGSSGYALGVGLFCVTLGYILIGFYHNVWGESAIDVQFMTLLALWTQDSTDFDDTSPGRKTNL